MRVICRAAAERPTGAQKAAAKAKPLANGLMQKKLLSSVPVSTRSRKSLQRLSAASAKVMAISQLIARRHDRTW